VHALWAFAWFCATAPLKAAWDAWRHARADLLAKTLLYKNKDALKLLDYAQPIGVLSIAGTAVIAVASFFAPVVNALLRLP
jgi:hypothetical protein